MLKLEYGRETIEALRYWRFHHPHPLVQLKMEVVLLRSQGVLNKQIQHICGISKATLYRYLTYVTAETVCELLRLLAGAYPAVPITIVLDNARCQKCALVQDLARSLGIELLYLPAYSPNLNVIERFWKWVKKQCLYGKYYPTSADFQAAIQQCIAQAHSAHLAALERLLTLKFQTFTEMPVLGEDATVGSSTGEKQQQTQILSFPQRKQAQKKVSSKAA